MVGVTGTMVEVTGTIVGVTGTIVGVTGTIVVGIIRTSLQRKETSVTKPPAGHTIANGKGQAEADGVRYLAANPCLRVGVIPWPARSRLLVAHRQK
jgi:hypothetical protein